MPNEFQIGEEGGHTRRPEMSAEDVVRAQEEADRASAEKLERLEAANKDFTKGLTEEIE